MKPKTLGNRERKPSKASTVDLASFPELNPNPISEVDLDGRVLYLNPSARRLFPDLAIKTAKHPWLADLQSVREVLQLGPSAWTQRQVVIDGCCYEQTIFFVADSRHVRVFGRDVTARKKMEEALLASRDEFERIVAERTEELRTANARLRSLTHDVVSNQEDERRRVARELHDDAGQALTALKLSLQLMKDQLPPDENSIRAGLEEAVSLADRTIEGIRRLAQDLRPPALDSAGLNEALEGLCGDFSRRTQIHIDYAGFDLSSLSPAAISLYRFLQEALTNAARHGHATRIHVLLQAHAARVFLSVEDDGQGFDPQAVLAIHPQPIGMGLLGMQERLQMVGGKLEVHSEPGHGAKLIAQVPLEQL